MPIIKDIKIIYQEHYYFFNLKKKKKNYIIFQIYNFTMFLSTFFARF